MKTSLYLTETDHFRSPHVLHAARECRDAGRTVAFLTCEKQSFFEPDAEIFTWPELIGYRPDLAILDNLYFDDENGEVITHLQRETPTVVTRLVLENLLSKLRAAGAREVILVCEQAAVSDAWKRHLDRLEIPLLKTDAERCRHWRLIDAYGKPYGYEEGMLRRPAEQPRMVQALFRRPESEALLALVCEYLQVEHEYCNPDDPGGVNKRWDYARRIVQALERARSGPDTMQERLMDDLGEMYDLVEEVFRSRSRNAAAGWPPPLNEVN